MQRSTTQTLWSYLPGSVFNHQDGFIAEVHHITGQRVHDLNRKILLDELGRELQRWRPDQVGIPNPTVAPDEFVIIKPEEVSFDVYPLTFECINPACKRVRRWWKQQDLINDTNATGQVLCSHPGCGSPMRQLRYLTAHNCGHRQPLHTQRCPNCGSTDDMYLEDVGSFRSSSWRCRSCGGSIGTRFTPCNCGQYPANPYQRGFTARDQRLWYPQSLTTLNISDQVYDHIQDHPQRAVAALVSWLGDQTDLSATLADLDRPSGGSRMSPEEWAAQEARLVEAKVDATIIEEMRQRHAPSEVGVAAVTATLSPEALRLADQREMIERAGLFDRRILEDRVSFAQIATRAGGEEAAATARVEHWMTSLGIADISVTQRLPIVLASYGYSRVHREPGFSHLRSYAQPNFYNGKTPIFALPALTEALLVTFDAAAILTFLIDQGRLQAEVPGEERAAKLTLTELLAQDPPVGGDGPAGQVRRLVHSASHALLRALDDGQSGFGESSMAEWIVPDALTSAIYIASYGEFTLGALDTVLRRRITHWLTKAADDVSHCDNDPMCSHISPARPHAACDRCLHLTFGCKSWNADLDRRLLRQFWLWTQRRAQDQVAA